MMSSLASQMRVLIMKSSVIKVSPSASVCALGKMLAHQLPAHEASAGDIAVLLEQVEAEEMVRHFSSEFPCLFCTGTDQDTVSNSVLTPDDDFYCHAQNSCPETVKLAFVMLF